MKSFINSFILTFLVAGTLLIGCEMPTGALNDSDTGAGSTIPSESAAFEDFSSTLTQELELSAEQQASLLQEMDRRGHPDRAPGNLWFVSVRLQETLTERQKTKLFHVAARLRGDHLRKLVGVYGPCTFERPVDAEQPEKFPIGLILDVMTDEQIRVATSLRERYADQIAAVRSGELSREEAARLIAQLHEELTGEIRSLLTEEQIALINRRLAARNGGDDAANDDLLAQNRRAMIAALELADAQIHALDRLHRTQCGTLADILRRAHAGELSREEVRSALDRLVTAKHEAYERILDRSQFEAANIHDALLVVNARRYIHQVTDRRGGDRMNDRIVPTRTGASG